MQETPAFVFFWFFSVIPAGFSGGETKEDGLQTARAIQTSPSFQKAELQSQSLNRQAPSCEKLDIRSVGLNPFGSRRAGGWENFDICFS